MTSFYTAGLTETEKAALLSASEAFVLIRELASMTMTEASQQLIHEMAHAFHNIPGLCSGTPLQRFGNAFVLEAGLRQVVQTYRRHGLHSHHLPTAT